MATHDPDAPTPLAPEFTPTVTGWIDVTRPDSGERGCGEYTLETAADGAWRLIAWPGVPHRALLPTVIEGIDTTTGQLVAMAAAMCGQTDR